MQYSPDQLRHEDWPQKNFDGRWLMARPLSDGYITRRIREAWLVLTGKADILVWEEGQ